MLLRRACEEEARSAQLSAQARETLEKAAQKLYDKECENLDEMERLFDYKAIPISHLVKVQLECGLLYAGYVHDLE